MRLCLLMWCTCLQIVAQSFDPAPSGVEERTRPGFPVAVELSRAVPGLRLLVPRPDGRQVVAQAEVNGLCGGAAYGMCRRVSMSCW